MSSIWRIISTPQLDYKNEAYSIKLFDIVGFFRNLSPVTAKKIMRISK
jgi:hypothetical protein